MLGAVGKDLKADPQLVAEAFEEAIREVSQKEARVVFEKGPSEEF